jgi:hypothetical protein
MRNCGGDDVKNMEDKLLPSSKVISRSVGLFAKLLVDLTGAGFQKVLVRRQKLFLPIRTKPSVCSNF